MPLMYPFTLPPHVPLEPADPASISAPTAPPELMVPQLPLELVAPPVPIGASISAVGPGTSSPGAYGAASVASVGFRVIFTTAPLPFSLDISLPAPVS